MDGLDARKGTWNDVDYLQYGRMYLDREECLPTMKLPEEVQRSFANVGERETNGDDSSVNIFTLRKHYFR